MPNENELPFLKAPVRNVSVIDDSDSVSGGAETPISDGLIFTSLPKVNGNPVAAVVSNFKNAPVRSIVTDLSDSFLFTLSNVSVKKFGSREEALLLLPVPVSVTVAPVKRRLRRAGA